MENDADPIITFLAKGIEIPVKDSMKAEIMRGLQDGNTLTFVPTDTTVRVSLSHLRTALKPYGYVIKRKRSWSR